jgi:putative hydrolase of the HAD superfamily
MLTTIGFDADDTLWQNETYFRLTQARFLQVLADHAAPERLAERLEAPSGGTWPITASG